MKIEATLCLLALACTCQAWEVVLSPNPNTNAVGQRPAGTPVAIMCTVSGLDQNDRPNITWTKSGGDISATGKVELKSLDPFTTSLTILNGTLDDNGIYLCTGEFGEDVSMAQIDIYFFEELRFADDIVEIDSPKNGIAVNLSCRVVPTKNTDLVTMWEKGIVALTPKSERNYTFFENGQILQITNYTAAQDEGHYHCKVFDRKSGSTISKEIKIGPIVKRRHHFCMQLCNNLCTSLYVKPYDYTGLPQA
uniref:Ig-like domain-containing protein n=1 Tax=Panagrellus redivivus TaxID=6233 RepID=A0A7E4ZXT0_PANRE